ncbi:MAG: type II toxin-antitoxin system VapC family toxin [Propionibacteriaceae bacterium]|nr:type II toxin-antitoxin system VapC family toxin [Propionibacteriaceae bacterium]
MIVLDTNIVSALITPEHPDFSIIDQWQQGCEDQDFRVTTITLAEIAYGVAILPEGAKKRVLLNAADKMIASTANFTLSFNSQAAAVYGQIMALRRSQGLPMSVLDAQIAACTYVAGAILATRNTRDFVNCGITIVNPYASA